MKKSLLILFALVFPAIGVAGESVTHDYAGNTNLTTAYGSDMPLMIAAAGATGEPPVTGGAAAGDDDLSFLDEGDIIEVWDPLEPINRGIFWFNDKMYFYLMKPIARGLRVVVPEPLLLGIRNFFENLRSPVRIVNSAARGQFDWAGDETTRFLVNSTLGIGGLFDPADEHFDIKPRRGNTGITMGYYGIGSGPYLVLPFLGPSNARDGIGLLADSRMDLTYHIWEHRDYWIAAGIDALTILALDKDTYEGIKKDALDPYLFVRDAYAQHRQSKIDSIRNPDDAEQTTE